MPTLRASLVALLVAGTILPVVGLALYEARNVSVLRDAQTLADARSVALAAAIRAEDAARRGDDPLAAASAGVGDARVLILQPDARYHSASGDGAAPDLAARIGTSVGGAALARDPDGNDRLVAWGRAPALDASVVVSRAPPAAAVPPLPFVLLAAFLVASVAVLLSFLATRVLAPVSRLERASAALGAGVWTERVTVEGTREVRELARSFNAMADEIERQRLDLDRLLHERTRDLREREEDLDAIRFTLAHEFREPLRSLRWIADDLVERPLRRGDREAVSLLRRRIDDLDALFRDLQRYEDVSRRPARIERLELDDLVCAVGALVGDAGPLEIERGPLPPVDGDRDLLTVALLEVLKNAAQHARGSGMIARVRLHAEPGAEDMEVHVDDEGPGIPSARREDVLHLFHRLRRDGAGTGVGLALARRALERHGGALVVSEAPGGGARVTLRLPSRGRIAPPPLPASRRRRTF